MAERSKRASNTALRFAAIKAKAKQPHRLLICEGYEDEVFFNRLIKEFKLPSYLVMRAEGKDKFKGAISKFRLEHTRTWSKLKHIVIVGDNDDDPGGNFENICEQINYVFGGPFAPCAPLIASNTNPPCVIIMIPWSDLDGSLEQLCCGAARSANRPLGDAVDHLLALARSDQWQSKTRHGKAWLRSNLAIRCADPCAPLGDVLKHSRHRPLIPISPKNESFKRIAKFLASLS